jgi:heme oxygenase
MIRSAIEEVYGIDATSGTAFYDFSAIPDHTVFKEAYRAQLDAAPWNEAERARIIDEVLLGYHHNTRVLVELS